ncbi:MAG: hypothetical protein IKG85_05690 [Clostridia bacterium]|nr:hypothetical protein [Clostridia bacterium]
MRRIISVIAAALLLMGVFAVPAFADQYGRFYIEGPTTAKVGDTIEISVKLEGEFSVNTLNIRVFFDNTSFRFVDKTMGEAFTAAQSVGGFALCDINQDANAISLGIMMPTTAMTVPGELVRAKFQVIGTASSSTEFAVQVEEFASMPIGQTIAYNLNCSSSGLKVSITGGTGTGTTEIPVNTPRPEGTKAPTSSTPNPVQPSNTEGRASRTEPTLISQDPKMTPDPASAFGTTPPDQTQSEDPAFSEAVLSELPVDASEQASANESEVPASRDNSGLHTALYIGGGVFAAAVIALIALLIKRNSNERKH